METNQIDATGQAFEQSQQFFGMSDGIVLVVPADILETDAPLVRPVVLLQQLHHLCQMLAFLDRHHLLALGTKGVMQRDSQMAFGLI